MNAAIIHANGGYYCRFVFQNCCYISPPYKQTGKATRHDIAKIFVINVGCCLVLSCVLDMGTEACVGNQEDDRWLLVQSLRSEMVFKCY